jgi:hypothetical protein
MVGPMKKNNSGIKAIALSFGYAEDGATSWLIFEGVDNHASRKDALLSLTEYLYQKFKEEKGDLENYLDRYRSNMAQCCQKAWRKRDDENPPERCPDCEALYTPKKKTNAFSTVEWFAFLEDIRNSTCDSYGYYDGDENWSPWGFSFDIDRTQMLVIYQWAQEILTIALAEIHPELAEDDDDCRWERNWFDKNRDKGIYDTEMEHMLAGKKPL